MSVQVLVATMNQMDQSLVERMNLSTGAIIGNQTSFNSIETVIKNEQKFMFLNFNEKGVGLNRNNALMRADADIVLFADDDEEMYDNYEEIINKAFESIEDADVLIFNVDGIPNGNNDKILKVNVLNFMKYGAVRIAARTRRLHEMGILFNTSFGGGCKYCHGEDTLFLSECLRKGLKIYKYPETIAKLCNNRESTWFKGYNDQYFRDTGKLYYVLSRKYWRLLCLQDALRHSKSYGRKWNDVYKIMTADDGVRK